MRQKLSGSSSASLARSTAYWLVGLQALLIIIIAAAVGCWIGGTTALSAFLGGSACVISNFFFARHVFAATNKTTRTVKRILANFYIGELIKLVLSAGLVLLIILFIPVSLVPLIVGFVGAQFVFWPLPLLIKLIGCRCTHRLK